MTSFLSKLLMALYITLASSLTLNTSPLVMQSAKPRQYITCAGTASTLQLRNHSLRQSELLHIPSPYHHIRFTYSTPKYTGTPSYLSTTGMHSRIQTVTWDLAHLTEIDDGSLQIPSPSLHTQFLSWNQVISNPNQKVSSLKYFSKEPTALNKKHAFCP